MLSGQRKSLRNRLGYIKTNTKNNKIAKYECVNRCSNVWNDKYSCKTECLLWILCQRQCVRSVCSGWHFPALTCQAAYTYMYFLLSSRCSYKGRSPSSNWSRSLSVQLWHALWKKCVKTDVLSNLRGKYNTSINNTLYQYNKIHCHIPVVDIKYLLLSFVTTAKESVVILYPWMSY